MIKKKSAKWKPCDTDDEIIEFAFKEAFRRYRKFCYKNGGMPLMPSLRFTEVDDRDIDDMLRVTLHNGDVTRDLFSTRMKYSTLDSKRAYPTLRTY